MIRILIALVLLIGALPMAAHAQDSAHALSQLNSLASMLLSVATLLGLVLFGAGIYRVYKHPQNPQQYTVASVIQYLVAGTLLLSIVTAYGVVTRTAIDSSWEGDQRSIIAIDQHAISEMDRAEQDSVLGSLMPRGMGAAVIGFVYVVGFISFVRGVYLIKEMGQRPGESAGVAKILTHIIGGVVAMNLTRSACLIYSLFSSGSLGFC